MAEKCRHLGVELQQFAVVGQFEIGTEQMAEKGESIQKSASDKGVLVPVFVALIEAVASVATAWIAAAYATKQETKPIM